MASGAHAVLLLALLLLLSPLQAYFSERLSILTADERLNLAAWRDACAAINGGSGGGSGRSGGASDAAASCGEQLTAGLLHAGEHPNASLLAVMGSIGDVQQRVARLYTLCAARRRLASSGALLAAPFCGAASGALLDALPPHDAWSLLTTEFDPESWSHAQLLRLSEALSAQGAYGPAVLLLQHLAELWKMPSDTTIERIFHATCPGEWIERIAPPAHVPAYNGTGVPAREAGVESRRSIFSTLPIDCALVMRLLYGAGVFPPHAILDVASGGAIPIRVRGGSFSQLLGPDLATVLAQSHAYPPLSKTFLAAKRALLGDAHGAASGSASGSGSSSGGAASSSELGELTVAAAAHERAVNIMQTLLDPQTASHAWNAIWWSTVGERQHLAGLSEFGAALNGREELAASARIYADGANGDESGTVDWQMQLWAGDGDSTDIDKPLSQLSHAANATLPSILDALIASLRAVGHAPAAFSALAYLAQMRLVRLALLHDAAAAAEAAAHAAATVPDPSASARAQDALRSASERFFAPAPCDKAPAPPAPSGADNEPSRGALRPPAFTLACARRRTALSTLPAFCRQQEALAHLAAAARELYPAVRAAVYGAIGATTIGARDGAAADALRFNGRGADRLTSEGALTLRTFSEHVEAAWRRDWTAAPSPWTIAGRAPTAAERAAVGALGAPSVALAPAVGASPDVPLARGEHATCVALAAAPSALHNATRASDAYGPADELAPAFATLSDDAASATLGLGVFADAGAAAAAVYARFSLEGTLPSALRVLRRGGSGGSSSSSGAAGAGASVELPGQLLTLASREVAWGLALTAALRSEWLLARELLRLVLAADKALLGETHPLLAHSLLTLAFAHLHIRTPAACSAALQLQKLARGIMTGKAAAAAAREGGSGGSGGDEPPLHATIPYLRSLAHSGHALLCMDRAERGARYFSQAAVRMSVTPALGSTGPLMAESASLAALTMENVALRRESPRCERLMDRTLLWSGRFSEAEALLSARGAALAAAASGAACNCSFAARGAKASKASSAPAAAADASAASLCLCSGDDSASRRFNTSAGDAEAEAVLAVAICMESTLQIAAVATESLYADAAALWNAGIGRSWAHNTVHTHFLARHALNDLRARLGPAMRQREAGLFALSLALSPYLDGAQPPAQTRSMGLLRQLSSDALAGLGIRAAPGVAWAAWPNGGGDESTTPTPTPAAGASSQSGPLLPHFRSALIPTDKLMTLPHICLTPDGAAGFAAVRMAAIANGSCAVVAGGGAPSALCVNHGGVRSFCAHTLPRALSLWNGGALLAEVAAWHVRANSSAETSRRRGGSRNGSRGGMRSASAAGGASYPSGLASSDLLTMLIPNDLREQSRALLEGAAALPSAGSADASALAVRGESDESASLSPRAEALSADFLAAAQRVSRALRLLLERLTWALRSRHSKSDWFARGRNCSSIECRGENDPGLFMMPGEEDNLVSQAGNYISHRIVGSGAWLSGSLWTTGSAEPFTCVGSLVMTLGALYSLMHEVLASWGVAIGGARRSGGADGGAGIEPAEGGFVWTYASASDAGTALDAASRSLSHTLRLGSEAALANWKRSKAAVASVSSVVSAQALRARAILREERSRGVASSAGAAEAAAEASPPPVLPASSLDADFAALLAPRYGLFSPARASGYASLPPLAPAAAEERFQFMLEPQRAQDTAVALLMASAKPSGGSSSSSGGGGGAPLAALGRAAEPAQAASSGGRVTEAAPSDVGAEPDKSSRARASRSKRARARAAAVEAAAASPVASTRAVDVLSAASAAAQHSSVGLNREAQELLARYAESDATHIYDVYSEDGRGSSFDAQLMHRYALRLTHGLLQRLAQLRAGDKPGKALLGSGGRALPDLAAGPTESEKLERLVMYVETLPPAAWDSMTPSVLAELAAMAGLSSIVDA